MLMGNTPIHKTNTDDMYGVDCVSDWDKVDCKVCLKKKPTKTIVASALVPGMSILGGWAIKSVEKYSDQRSQHHVVVTYTGGDSDTFKASAEVTLD